MSTDDLDGVLPQFDRGHIIVGDLSNQQWTPEDKALFGELSPERRTFMEWGLTARMLRFLRGLDYIEHSDPGDEQPQPSVVGITTMMIDPKNIAASIKAETERWIARAPLRAARRERRQQKKLRA